jgi:hypothetical protein
MHPKKSQSPHRSPISWRPSSPTHTTRTEQHRLVQETDENEELGKRDDKKGTVIVIETFSIHTYKLPLEIPLDDTITHARPPFSTPATNLPDTQPEREAVDVVEARTKPDSEHRSPDQLRWTEMNPEWAESWKASLTYPLNAHKGRTIVEKEDIERLDEGEFFNDNLINFYLSWLQCHLEEVNPSLASRIYVFNTFLQKFDKWREGLSGY